MIWPGEAQKSSLENKLASAVGQELNKTNPEYYLAKREQFKDSSGKLIPEIVLHLKDTVDQVTAPDIA